MKKKEVGGKLKYKECEDEKGSKKVSGMGEKKVGGREVIKQIREVQVMKEKIFDFWRGVFIRN